MLQHLQKYILIFYYSLSVTALMLSLLPSVSSLRNLISISLLALLLLFLKFSKFHLRPPTCCNPNLCPV
uniref:Putative product n=1 Tax=Xenopsylla cheopis TaxID=163159 RepID=A0A6M2DZT7_XENCH